eukprot:4326506-Amphidinium_carterae.1
MPRSPKTHFQDSCQRWVPLPCGDFSCVHNESALGASAVDLNMHSDRSSLCARRTDHATMQTKGGATGLMDMLEILF